MATLEILDLTIAPMTAFGEPVEIADQHNPSATFEFDRVNDFLGSSVKPIPNGGTKGTISGWLRYNGNAAFFLNQRNLASSVHWYCTVQTNGRVDFNAVSAGTLQSESVASTIPNDNVTWKHVLFTFDLVAQDINIYANGIEVSYLKDNFGSCNASFATLPNLGVASLHNDSFDTGLGGSFSRFKSDDSKVFTAAEAFAEFTAELSLISPIPGTLGLLQVGR